MERKPTWTDSDTEDYAALAPVAVPARREQLAVIACLLPFEVDAEFSVVEIGCGQGALARTLLQAFERCSVVALDGSAAMRARARALLEPFMGRAAVEGFELAERGWRPRLDGADCVVSSLCLHHLSDAAKRELYADLFTRTSRRGAVVVADLVAPQRAEPRALFASTWDAAAARQARTHRGPDDLWERFQAARWNHYRWPDPVDRPAPLHHHLRWLADAGFGAVDCFWMSAGHAIFGGYKAGAPPQAPLEFGRAYALAGDALAALGT